MGLRPARAAAVSVLSAAQWEGECGLLGEEIMAEDRVDIEFKAKHLSGAPNLNAGRAQEPVA